MQEIESRSVRLKYARSGDYLAGIGLNPDDDVMELVECYLLDGQFRVTLGRFMAAAAGPGPTGQLLPMLDYVSGVSNHCIAYKASTSTSRTSMVDRRFVVHPTIYVSLVNVRHTLADKTLFPERIIQKHSRR